MDFVIFSQSFLLFRMILCFFAKKDMVNCTTCLNVFFGIVFLGKFIILIPPLEIV